MSLRISPRLIKRALSAMLIAPFVLWLINEGGHFFIAMLVLFMALAFYEWARLSMRTQFSFPLSLFGLIYISTAFLSCFLIRERFGAEASLLFILMVWASDIGAYTFGKLIGGARMTPTISPNKTWAGFAGALIFPVIVCLSFVIFLDGVPSDNLWFFVLMTVCVGGVTGLCSQIGDLLVSLFKRYVHVKDTGDLIPGHGGVLDRVDSLLLAAPIFFQLVKYLERVLVVN